MSSYTEGCYSGIRTLQATNLWTPLTSLTRVDTVVSYWLLNLEKNGCHNLLRAGADGVIPAPDHLPLLTQDLSGSP